MAPTPPSTRSATEWTAILDRIQADLTRSLEQTPEPAPLPPFDPKATHSAPVAELDRRMDALQGSLDRAEQFAAETDALLHAETATLRQWNETIKQVREKLANWVASAA